MNKHYILNIDPHSQHEWEQNTLRDPLTGQHPNFAALIAQSVNNQTGSYLVAINIEVQVLETSTANPSKLRPLEIAKANNNPVTTALVASSA